MRLYDLIEYNNIFKEGTWVRVHGYCTPGGDPVFKCSNCGEDVHVYGIEHSFNEHEVCKNCGSHNKYTY